MITQEIYYKVFDFSAKRILVLHTCRLCLGKLLLSNYFLNKFFINDAVLIKFAELIWLIKMFVHTKNNCYSAIKKIKNLININLQGRKEEWLSVKTYFFYRYINTHNNKIFCHLT